MRRVNSGLEMQQPRAAARALPPLQVCRLDPKPLSLPAEGDAVAALLAKVAPPPLSRVLLRVRNVKQLACDAVIGHVANFSETYDFTNFRPPSVFLSSGQRLLCADYTLKVAAVPKASAGCAARIWALGACARSPPLA